MPWPSNWLRPDRQQYKKFENQLSRKSSKRNIESGLMVFLAMLFVIPLIIALMFALIYLFSKHPAMGELVFRVPILFGIVGSVVCQA